MRLRLERELEEIQETGELPAGSLRIVSWQSVNELPRSKLTGCQNIAMRIDPKGVTPECFNRGSTVLTTTLSHVEWVGGPVSISPGFPIEAFGNDGL